MIEDHLYATGPERDPFYSVLQALLAVFVPGVYIITLIPCLWRLQEEPARPGHNKSTKNRQYESTPAFFYMLSSLGSQEHIVARMRAYMHARIGATDSSFIDVFYSVQAHLLPYSFRETSSFFLLHRLSDLSDGRKMVHTATTSRDSHVYATYHENMLRGGPWNTLDSNNKERGRQQPPPPAPFRVVENILPRRGFGSIRTKRGSMAV